MDSHRHRDRALNANLKVNGDETLTLKGQGRAKCYPLKSMERGLYSDVKVSAQRTAASWSTGTHQTMRVAETGMTLYHKESTFSLVHLHDEYKMKVLT